MTQDNPDSQLLSVSQEESQVPGIGVFVVVVGVAVNTGGFVGITVDTGVFVTAGGLVGIRRFITSVGTGALHGCTRLQSAST